MYPFMLICASICAYAIYRVKNPKTHEDHFNQPEWGGLAITTGFIAILLSVISLVHHLSGK